LPVTGSVIPLGVKEVAAMSARFRVLARDSLLIAAAIAPRRLTFRKFLSVLKLYMRYWVRLLFLICQPFWFLRLLLWEADRVVMSSLPTW